MIQISNSQRSLAFKNLINASYDAGSLIAPNRRLGFPLFALPILLETTFAENDSAAPLRILDPSHTKNTETTLKHLLHRA